MKCIVCGEELSPGKLHSISVAGKGLLIDMVCPNHHSFEVRFAESDVGVEVDVMFVTTDFPFPEINVSVGGVDNPLEYTGEAVEVVRDPIRDRLLYWLKVRRGDIG